ncbi:MAG: NFACT RNA binding domain-containing protein [candidate division Zixibacteria bacterium]|nr:NFACT RNA binding domain-containing protein [candidate division Zixibacteria bacterium]MDH3937210.1 NFACT RNA binding domain-containing protein [candidate division Zixibacteria bacterium]MDH4032667.1 NFACT RNA binding domain-containing protein [candidate division Zixibacteria bacterium]
MTEQWATREEQVYLSLVAKCRVPPYIRRMQTSLHIMALVESLESEAIGARITATEFYKKERAVYIILKKDKARLALGLRYHPAGAGLFLVPASKIRVETKEKPRSIFSLEEGCITAVAQLGFDRIISVTVEKTDGRSHLLFEALGPNGNLWHLNDSFGMLASLRRKSFTIGERYQPPPLPDKLDPREVTAGSIGSAMNDQTLQSVSAVLAKTVHGFGRTLAREVVARADCDGLSVDACDEAACMRLAQQIKETVGQFRGASGGQLYDHPDGVEVYPFRLKTSAQTATKFKTLSLATLAMCDLKRSGREEADDEKRLLGAVDRQLKKLTRRLAKVEEDLKTAVDFERYKRTGELLQINFDRLRTGLDNITVDDVFDDKGETISIKLDPALAPRQNVEAYFKKFRKGRDGEQLLKRRLEITKGEISAITEIQAALHSNFESALKRYEQELTALGGRPGGGQAEQTVRLPYREYLLTTGLRLLVGRDGADNDRTTFDHARPYELWFHAQQCPGSHVVLKFPNKSFVPSKAEVEEAAAVAAYHSKARNDSLVPIVYTERRYVRKPRKAKPGLVTLQREKSIMVAPRPPLTK